MWEKFGELREALLAFSNGTGLSQEPSIKATVLPLRKPD
jgi:hypothetical protein